MKLIRTDGETFEDEPLVVIPLPPELKAEIRARINSQEEHDKVDEINRRRAADNRRGFLVPNSY